MKDDQNLYRQQAELTKERKEINALFELLKIVKVKDAAMPQGRETK